MKKVLKATIKAKGNNMTAAVARKYAIGVHSQDFYFVDGENVMLRPGNLSDTFEAIHALYKARDLSYALRLACTLVDGYRAACKKAKELRGSR